MKKPPPFVPICLIESCDATGPVAMVCSVTGFAVGILCGLNQRYGCAWLESLGNSLRHENKRQNDGQWKQDIEDRPAQIDPEVSNGFSSYRSHSANQCDHDGHAHCSRRKILNDHAAHLCQVAHGRFTAIALPVCIGREAQRGIPREIRGYRTHAHRIERQKVLEALQEIERHHADGAEEHHGPCIRLPRHRLFRIDAANPIEKTFEAS